MMDRFYQTRFNALLVAAGRVLINFKAKLKVAAPMLLKHVFAVEKAKCVSLFYRILENITHFYSVQVRKNNHLRNVQGLLVRQLLKLLLLYPAPFQYHTFRAKTIVRTHLAQRLPDGHRPKYIVLARQKERVRLLRMS